MSNIQYRAFISYSHRDSQWGTWLHKKLESYQFPAAIRNQYPQLGKSLYPIFRDREELPGSSDLGSNINYALTHSDSLLIICSPNSAASMWVNEEIINYQKLSPNKPIIALIVAGNDQDNTAKDYCLPNEVALLIAANAAIVSVIDCRTSGQSQALKLNLISQIASSVCSELNPQKLAQHERKRSILRRTASLMGVILLSTISYFIWQQITSHQQLNLLAESSQLAFKSQQATARAEHGLAIQLAQQALPKNLKNPERPLNNDAVAAINNVMQQPFIKINRFKFNNQTKALIATHNKNLWLIQFMNNQFALVNIHTNQIIWQLKTDSVQQVALNDLNELIIRTDKALLNYQLVSGKLNCQLLLNSTGHYPSEGSFDWIQKNWIAEVNHYPSDKDFKIIKDVQFINTHHCEAEQPRGYSLTSTVSLVAVLNDGSKITAADIYYENKNLVAFVQWPKDSAEKQELLFTTPGHTRELIHGNFNLRQYSGPLIKTRGSESESTLSQTIFTFQNPQQANSAEYLLALYDWQQKKFLQTIKLTGRPYALRWQDKNKRQLLIFSTNENQKHANKLDLETFELDGNYQFTGDWQQVQFAPEKPFILSANLMTPGLVNLSDLGVQQLPLPSDAKDWLVDHSWVDQQHAIQLTYNGNINSLHLQNPFVFQTPGATHCCHKRWNFPQRTLLLDYQNQFKWLEHQDGNIENIMTFDSTEYKKLGGIYLERFLLLKKSTEEQQRIEILDLQQKEIVFSDDLKEYEDIPLENSNTQHLTYYRNDKQIVLLDLKNIATNKVFESSYPYAQNHSLTFSEDGSEFLEIWNNSDYNLGVEKINLKRFAWPSLELKQQQTKELVKAEVLAKESLAKESSETEKSTPAVSYATMKLYVDPRNQRLFSINLLGTNFEKVLLSSYRLNDLSLIQEFEFTSKYFNSLMSHQVSFTKNTVLFQADSLFGNKKSILIDLTNQKTIENVSDDSELYFQDELLAKKYIVIRNTKQANYQLKNINTQHTKELNCKFQHDSQIYFQTGTNLLWIAAENLCAIDLETGNLIFNRTLPAKDFSASSINLSYRIWENAKQINVLNAIGVHRFSASLDWQQWLEQAEKLNIPRITTTVNENFVVGVDNADE